MKTALITGANSGIGKTTAIELAGQGYHLIMVCRNREKAEEARREIAQKTAHEKIDIILCDLGLMNQVREAAKTIRDTYPKLDLLVNNAGMLPDRNRKTTSEGLEVTFAVNHLSYFLLTNELLPLLSKAGSARIVNVASEAHRSGRFEPENLQLEEGYSTYKAYGNSKLFNIMFTRRLAVEVEGTGITAYSLHPGVVNTRFASNSDSIFAKLFDLGRFFMISPEKGAETTNYLCTEPGIESLSGQYFVKKKPVKPQVKTADDDDACDRLWRKSEEILESVLNSAPENESPR